MKIAVIAAGGRSGQAFVEMALAAGHDIRAGVHSKSHLTPHPKLTVVVCDATNESELRNLLRNQEAVASFIGHVKGSASDVQTVAIQKVCNVMNESGIKRLISLTGTAVHFPNDKVSLIDRLLNLSITIIDPARINDGKNHVEVLKQSDLEWTVIRVLKLQNTAPKPYQLSEHGPAKWIVGRAEVAQAILQVLEQHSYIRLAPMISKP